ncbi:hypothetical protein REG_0452 [Candidatus Regiella insecticola LSR1]|uniref:Uncharacterized protein n=1 Tax=Candidatus Regiella insecticola LSR1 TaxID=663321 RepID=E0WR72_9ENTR|nr:hypothetical protein REG_0452 [Candidatus Regiella insecticola LSR1]
MQETLILRTKKTLLAGKFFFVTHFYGVKRWPLLAFFMKFYTGDATPLTG